jgi:hypothetical protein
VEAASICPRLKKSIAFRWASALAESLAASIHVPVIDLDLLNWEGNGYDRKRDEDAARRMTLEVSTQPLWIIEGVYGWLADVALPRATALIWLDFPWSLCRAGLLARGPRRGATDQDAVALLKWAETYWNRQTPSSFAGHSRMFANFPSTKFRLRAPGPPACEKWLHGTIEGASIRCTRGRAKAGWGIRVVAEIRLVSLYWPQLSFALYLCLDRSFGGHRHYYRMAVRREARRLQLGTGIAFSRGSRRTANVWGNLSLAQQSPLCGDKLRRPRTALKETKLEYAPRARARVMGS